MALDMMSEFEVAEMLGYERLRRLRAQGLLTPCFNVPGYEDRPTYPAHLIRFRLVEDQRVRGEVPVVEDRVRDAPVVEDQVGKVRNAPVVTEGQPRTRAVGPGHQVRKVPGRQGQRSRAVVRPQVRKSARRVYLQQPVGREVSQEVANAYREFRALVQQLGMG
jgi:hypothetical protein